MIENAKDFVGWLALFAGSVSLIAIPVLLWWIGTTLDRIRLSQAARTGIVAVESGWFRERHEDWKARRARERAREAEAEAARVAPGETI